MGHIIDYFGTGNNDAGDHSFLSNFYWYNNTTLEHQYQAAKTDNPVWKSMILEAETPKRAKQIGNMRPLPGYREGWDDEKVSVMWRLLREHKFVAGTELAQLLLDTGDAELIEGNWWGDTFWGQVDGVGENWLGRLLMARREELRA